MIYDHDTKEKFANVSQLRSHKNDSFETLALLRHS